MKKQNMKHLTFSCLAAVALLACATTTVEGADPPPLTLQGQLEVRPLTPQEIKDYSLPADTQVSSGLSTVGVGAAVHLEAWVHLDIPSSEISSIGWTLVQKPIGSTATLEASPLSTDIPIAAPTDRLVSRLADRKFLRPDRPGQYTVEASITTTSHGSTNITRTITAATYMGAQTCALCHSGGIVAPNIYEKWSETAHATKFTRDIDGKGSSHFNSNCVSCHTVGHDKHPNAVNSGFDDIAAQHGWTFPGSLTNGNWAAMPQSLKNLSNIQCENCHGPGSEHAFSLGSINRISVSWDANNCAQCHDSKDKHPKNAEWNNSRHAVATRYPTGEGRGSCVQCHSGPGFADAMKGLSASTTRYEAIGCTTCHDPHDAKNPHQLRAATARLANGKTITKGGTGTLCMNCHKSRVDASTYVETAAANSRFGPHNATQADMLAGENAVTYGKSIPSSPHGTIIKDSCTTCHMQKLDPSSPVFTKAGGHTFKARWESDTPGVASVDLVSACTQCHGPTESFNFARHDYDGNGLVEGIQTEVRGLLDQLGRLLPPMGSPSVSITASYTRPQLRAAFNYKFVDADGSYGVHNPSYAVGLLRASIADLTGDANRDGLPDWWQIQHFGSISNPNAAPNAMPANDNVPNWLKYALGLNPKEAGVVLPDGVVWSNGSSSSGSTDTIQIYTAAEVVFHTEANKTYQLQAISSLGGGWNDVGVPIPGTGGSFSFVTPTRNKTQQFFRVLKSE
jgi:hypothetical protein